MFNAIATLYTYRTAPKATFFVKHPIRALAARRLLSRLTGETARKVALGTGAAVVALPIGLWLGRKAAGD